MLRGDHGSRLISHIFRYALRLLAIESSPSCVHDPKDNGYPEWFILTLDERALRVHRFETVIAFLEALRLSKNLCNKQWLIARHDHTSPSP